MLSNIKRKAEEQYILEQAFKRTILVYIRLVLVNASEAFNSWPAMQQEGCIAKFVYRNDAYARPPEDSIYRKQSV